MDPIEIPVSWLGEAFVPIAMTALGLAVHLGICWVAWIVVSDATESIPVRVFMGFAGALSVAMIVSFAYDVACAITFV
jgi:hypothetical protein